VAKKSLIIVQVLIGVLLFSVSRLPAETAEDYFRRTGKAYVVKDGTYSQVAAATITTTAEIQASNSNIKLDNPVTSHQDKATAAAEYNRRGITKAKAGQSAQAIVDFNTAIELEPNYPQAFHNRGLVYFSQNNFTQAIREFSNSIRLDPNYSAAYYDRALAYAAEGSYSLVITDCTKLIELEPAFQEAYKLRSSAYAMLKESGKAKEDTNIAKTLKPSVVSEFSN
jgi:tetratricopeptide (TPR) repeat protein